MKKNHIGEYSKYTLSWWCTNLFTPFNIHAWSEDLKPLKALFYPHLFDLNLIESIHDCLHNFKGIVLFRTIGGSNINDLNQN